MRERPSLCYRRPELTRLYTVRSRVREEVEGTAQEQAHPQASWSCRRLLQLIWHLCSVKRLPSANTMKEALAEVKARRRDSR